MLWFTKYSKEMSNNHTQATYIIYTELFHSTKRECKYVPGYWATEDMAYSDTEQNSVCRAVSVPQICSMEYAMATLNLSAQGLN